MNGRLLVGSLGMITLLSASTANRKSASLYPTPRTIDIKVARSCTGDIPNSFSTMLRKCVHDPKGPAH